MVRTNREQRVALKRVFDRCPINDQGDSVEYKGGRPISYREFRRSIHGTFGCDGCIMVKWCGMWLGIEKDGYTHS